MERNKKVAILIGVFIGAIFLIPLPWPSANVQLKIPYATFDKYSEGAYAAELQVCADPLGSCSYYFGGDYSTPTCINDPGSPGGCGFFSISYDSPNNSPQLLSLVFGTTTACGAPFYAPTFEPLIYVLAGVPVVTLACT